MSADADTGRRGRAHGDHRAARAHFAALETEGDLGERGSTWADRVVRCDVCSRSMLWETFMIDGPAEAVADPRRGSLCVVCALRYSPAIGWGCAQMYRRDGRRWRLVLGGPPVECGMLARTSLSAMDGPVRR